MATRWFLLMLLVSKSSFYYHESLNQRHILCEISFPVNPDIHNTHFVTVYVLQYRYESIYRLYISGVIGRRKCKHMQLLP